MVNPATNKNFIVDTVGETNIRTSQNSVFNKKMIDNFKYLGVKKIFVQKYLLFLKGLNQILRGVLFSEFFRTFY